MKAVRYLISLLLALAIAAGTATAAGLGAPHGAGDATDCAQLDASDAGMMTAASHADCDSELGSHHCRDQACFQLQAVPPALAVADEPVAQPAATLAPAPLPSPDPASLERPPRA